MRLRIFLLLSISLLLKVMFFSCNSINQKAESKQATPNILFIPVDDLRPELGAYGVEFVKTPNVDRLAEQGLTFTRAYCHQAVCNPSRASLLTGLRPYAIRVWNLQTSFRNTVPDGITMPQYFNQNGYTTIGLGKVFHIKYPETVSRSLVPQNSYGFPFSSPLKWFLLPLYYKDRKPILLTSATGLPYRFMEPGNMLLIPIKPDTIITAGMRAMSKQTPAPPSRFF